MKVYIVEYFGKTIAGYKAREDAEEMVLSLWQECKYEKFMERLNFVHTWEHYWSEYKDSKCRRYKNKEEYEAQISKEAWGEIESINRGISFICEIKEVEVFE